MGLTWQAFREAVDRWGVQDDEEIIGIRFLGRDGPMGIGIRRTARGIEIVTRGSSPRPEGAEAPSGGVQPPMVAPGAPDEP